LLVECALKMMLTVTKVLVVMTTEQLMSGLVR
jgi:hypothetical protein